MRTAWICSFFFAFFLIFSSNTMLSVYAATANLSTTWATKQTLFVLETDKFACGFYCDGNCTSYFFAILMIHWDGYLDFDQMDPIWSANRDNPVREGAILNLTAAGELVLHDADGSIVWTTNTIGKSVAGMRLNDDGNLVLFDGHQSMVWQSFDHPTDCLVQGQMLFRGQKLIPSDLGECSYPLACGRNAICLGDKQCRCPRTDYFRVVDDRQPNMGCSQITPLTCNATQHQNFIELKNIKYFTDTPDMEDVDLKSCKQACLSNCSCKAAIFKYQDSNISSGDCYLPSELFTMMSVDEGVLPYDSSTFIKVQNVTSPPSSNIIPYDDQLPKRKNKVRAAVLGSTGGIFLLLFIVVAGFIKCFIQKKKRDSEIEEEYLDQLPGLPTRFSYEELNTATHNFSRKLGEGGFGSVFQGTLEDGSQIAVKCLEGLVHIKRSFLAEVESIGSIHHVNLVRLRGFCAWKSQRLLVYEFMSNGSLDQWIYYGDRRLVLGWECRKKIILDIAKGLAYLHEDCRQKIIHLDIKPQNILLDEDFNAKVSDFGLAKLIDRNQSQVISTMRGTPGYMAPEWVSSIITEKMDVYSFGIVLLEILCGRKNFDRSQPEESWHLLRVFQSCWEEGTLLSIVDRYNEDVQVHGTEVMEMMKVASWCLQAEFAKRPSMSSVVKVLEGVTSIGTNLDYNFLHPKLQNMTDEHEKSSKPVLPSILSGPR